MAYTKDLAQPLNDTNLDSALQDISIPPRPLTLERIIKEAKKDEPDLNLLTRLISSDLAVSAGLIKIANSPFFGVQRRVQTIKEALMVLGLLATCRAVACISFRQAFPATPALERFWDSSAKIARLAGWLAQSFTSNTLQADDAYTFALFRDCGIPILLIKQPDYETILAKANEDPVIEFTLVEEMYLPTNHAVVGNLMAQSWWLNDEICLSILHHHNVMALDSPFFPVSIGSRHRIAIAQLSEYLLQKHTSRCGTKEWEKLGPSCLNILGIQAEDLEEIAEYAKPIIEADV